ncbi:MAG: OpgC domain-containing protein [Candidatus Competibacteraceae bacterium]|nr:MAG: OpgC domain-containing protein [Candidatus Competibacteraceae bacterium]
MNRFLEIDALRGLLLVLMVINHTPSPLRSLTNQPLGFVSAAEAFVFVSACLCGLVFGRRLHDGGLPEVSRMARRRVRQIYTGHVLTLLFCFAIIGQGLGHLSPFHNMLHPYLEQPTKAAVSALLLLYQPPLLDILPMYLLFLLLTPFVLNLLVRAGFRAVLVVSLLLWLAAQCGLKEWLVGALAGGWLVIAPGAFDLLAWQLLWVSGLFLGYRLQQQRPKRAVLILPRIPWPVLVSVALFLFCWRWSWIPLAVNFGDPGWLLDKWRLGPLRLLNFFALLYLALWLGPYFAKALGSLKPLILIGRNTLPLFCLHTCFGLLAVGVIELYELPDGWRYLILALHLALILASSLILDKLSNNPSSDSVPAPSVRG